MTKKYNIVVVLVVLTWSYIIMTIMILNAIQTWVQMPMLIQLFLYHLQARSICHE